MVDNGGWMKLVESLGYELDPVTKKLRPVELLRL